MPAFDHILCATDFSDAAHHALRTATRLAVEHAAALALVHVRPAGAPPDPAEVALDPLAREARAAGAAGVTGRVIEGDPAEAIVALAAAAPGRGLVVVGTHGRTGVRRAMLGSVAEHVVRHAPCPVLTVRGTVGGRAFRHALVAVDFSAASRAAAALALELVARDGDLTAVHVLDVPARYRGELTPPDTLAAIDPDAARRARALIDELRSRALVPVYQRTRIGSPAGQLVAMLAQEPRFDLIVTGSHGRTGLGRLALGSVAERVVRHADRSVLVVPPAGA